MARQVYRRPFFCAVSCVEPLRREMALLGVERMIRKFPATVPQNNVQRHAYEIWLREGRPEGKSLEHWLRAEQEVRDPPAPQPTVHPRQSIYFWDYHG